MVLGKDPNDSIRHSKIVRANSKSATRFGPWLLEKYVVAVMIDGDGDENWIVQVLARIRAPIDDGVLMGWTYQSPATVSHSG